MIKPPNLAVLKAEYDWLVGEKERLYAQYGEAKKTLKEFGVIKQNVEQLLGRQAELGSTVFTLER